MRRYTKKYGRNQKFWQNCSTTEEEVQVVNDFIIVNEYDCGNTSAGTEKHANAEGVGLNKTNIFSCS